MVCAYSPRNANQDKTQENGIAKKTIMIPIKLAIISLKDNFNSNCALQ